MCQWTKKVFKALKTFNFLGTELTPKVKQQRENSQN